MSAILANKYRPKKLSDVVGQDIVIQTLSNALLNNRLHHSYLFVGQFGSGKTTTARILAASENCPVSPGLNPCGNCVVCKTIFSGRNEDVEEIDAASNAGNVDSIRNLKRSCVMSSVSGIKKRYFIIDEAHNMSSAAEEALLKLLEEPPSHIRIILCTTEPKDMRPTIVSRCQRHDFKQIYWSLIMKHLQYICKNEKISAEEGALALCARLAQGSMRNGIQNLQKVLDYSGTLKITIEQAVATLGYVSDNFAYDIFDEILIKQNNEKPDATNAFRIINGLIKSGCNIDSLFEVLETHLGNLLAGITSTKAGEFIVLTEQAKVRLKEQLLKCRTMKALKAIGSSMEELANARLAVKAGQSPEIILRLWFTKTLFAFYSK